MFTSTRPSVAVKHRAHSPDVGADTVPLTSTPSDTDSNRRSNSSGAPRFIAIRSSPIRAGLGTVSISGCIAPGRRGRRETSNVSGDRELRWIAARDCVAITPMVGGPQRRKSRPSTLRVVVGAGRGAQLVPSPPDRTQRTVEVLLELGELAVDVDVAFAAQ